MAVNPLRIEVKIKVGEIAERIGDCSQRGCWICGCVDGIIFW